MKYTDVENWKANTELEKEVKEIILNELEKDETRPVDSWFEDLQRCGCVSGMVLALVYYTNTIVFYNKHKEDINALLYELLESTGMSVEEIFGDKWDANDPLCLDTTNQNLMAWYAFEEIAYRIYEELLED